MRKHDSNTNSLPQVIILMGVFNGARFLSEQLESIVAQTHTNWHLICSDDRSTDQSYEIILEFARKHTGKVSIKQGPGQGFSANFLALIANLPQPHNFVCFSDQDDVWKPDKIARGLHLLGRDPHRLNLYCGRRANWHPSKNRTVLSPRLNRPCSLRNALIENVASGNTIMLNPAAAAFCWAAAQQTGGVFAHDWWLYLLITAAGGRITYDNGPPQVLYRQHDANLIGAGNDIRTKLHRKISVLGGAFADRIDGNLNALACVDHVLTEDARAICSEFSAARKAGLIKRMRTLHGIAPYRQRRRDSFSFWGAAGLGCI